MEQDCSDEVALGFGPKKDCLWVKWVHIFYMKWELADNCLVPKNATLFISKILESRKINLIISSLDGGVEDKLHAVVRRDRFLINNVHFPNSNTC